jgi:phosphonopyruvate decarboxylase
MIKSKEFYNCLKENDIDFFCGVPDSLLKDICAFITKNTDKKNHIISSNEGAAIALASGFHLSTGKIPLVYMQNSGIGNAINPLLSLADKNVYSVPMLLMIGWRGEPGVKDEPQHITQGKLTLSLLDLMNIPYEIISSETKNFKKVLNQIIKQIYLTNIPHAIVIKKNTFEPFSLSENNNVEFKMSREDAIKIIVDNLNDEDIVISTTGKTSRELFEYRKEKKQKHNRDFLTVGSMGHSSQIALSIANEKKHKNVFCIDGDGSVIMHAGSLGIIGFNANKNFKHIIINNGSHDSVGGQPTIGHQVSFGRLALEFGYRSCFYCKDSDSLINKINLLKDSEGPSLLEIKVKKGARNDLGRPTRSPLENKLDFMNFLNDETDNL